MTSLFRTGNEGTRPCESCPRTSTRRCQSRLQAFVGERMELTEEQAERLSVDVAGPS
jgi:hypothetical protein